MSRHDPTQKHPDIRMTEMYDEMTSLRAKLAKTKRELERQVAALRSSLASFAANHSCGSVAHCDAAKILKDTESTASAHDERIRQEAQAELRRELEKYDSMLILLAKDGIIQADAPLVQRAIERHRARKEER